MASTTHRDMQCTPAQVFDVLGDGWLFGVWVVGASRIRDVETDWPMPGSRIHHSVGSWPVMINDTTSVVELDPQRSIRLRARAWPAGEAEVLITVAPTPGGCRVAITEDAVKGPGTVIPSWLRDPMLHWRNTETLRRLDYLVRGRTEPKPPA